MATTEIAAQEIVPTTVLTLPTLQNLEAFRQGLQSEYEYELAEAQADYEEARKRGGGHLTQLTRAFRRVFRAQLKLRALDEGYFPVPRMPVEWVNSWRLEQFNAPDNVKARFDEAVAAGIFERITMVVPDEPIFRQQQRRRRTWAATHIDPMLIGVIGLGTVKEEHFLVAWWR